MAFWCSLTINKSLLGNKLAPIYARKGGRSHFNNDNNTRTAIYACLLLLGIIVGGLRKRLYLTWERSQAAPGFCLADARKHYEENIEHLCFPEI